MSAILMKGNAGKILNLFFQNPDRELYLREIGKYLKREPGFFQHTIKNLVEEGILNDRRRGNLRFFRLNKAHPLYEELKKIISKTLGAEAQLKKMVDDFEGIRYAFIFGSMAKNQEGPTSDIDLFLIGKANQDVLIQNVNRLEEKLKREINYHLFSVKEVRKKMKNNNEFVERVLKESKIILKGNLDELRKTA